MNSFGKGQPWANRTLDSMLKFRTLYFSMYIILRVYCVRNLMDQQNKQTFKRLSVLASKRLD